MKKNHLNLEGVSLLSSHKNLFAAGVVLVFGIVGGGHAQTNVVLNGTTGTNIVSSSYFTTGGLNLSLGLGVDYLVVGGGGGGGTSLGGGGGAGGLLQGSVTVGAGNFAVQVGAGGAAGTNGVNSSWNGLTAVGGGAGGGLTGAGSVGGSGGGAGGRANANGANGTSGQGNKGGNEAAGDFDGAAGGGGASAAGANSASGRAGNGGAGVQSSITGTSSFYAAGGGGGGYVGNIAGTGGSGIGGNGGMTAGATSGAAGTGSGGGGGGGGPSASFNGASGGSGVVIIRYLGGPLATGGTTSSGTGSATGYTLHTFSGTGSNNFNLSSANLDARLGATLTGTLTGSGGVTYNGPGTLTLASNNSLYSGTTKITGGTLAVASANALGTGAVELLTPGTALNFNAGVTNYYIQAGLSTVAGTKLGLNGTVNITGQGLNTIASDISGSGALAVSGMLVTLSGSNSHTGGTIIRSGTVTALNDSAWGTGPITTMSSAGGPVFGASTTLTNQMNWLGYGGTVEVQSGYEVTLAGTVTVAQGRFYKAGAGTIYLTATNGSTYTDGITVSEGRLRGTTGSLSSQIEINQNTAVEFYQTNNGVISLGIRGAGKLIKTGQGTLSFSSSAAGATSFTGGTEVQEGRLQVSGFYGGNVNVSSNAVLEFTSGGQYQGSISGNGSMVKSGAARLGLFAASTYTGGTEVNGGTVELHGNGQLASTGALTVNSGGTFVINNTSLSQTVSSLSGAGAVNLGSGTLTTGANSSEFSGRIYGAGNLIKDGVGTFTLSGSNSYSGDTSVNGGKLVLASSNALGQASVVKIGAGGTLEASQRVVVGFVDLNGGTVIGSNNLVSALTLVNSGTVSGLADGSDFNAGILKRTTGVATVNGANSFTGTVKIEAGTVQMASGGSFNQASSLYLYDGATMDLNGLAQTFSKLDGAAGTVSLGSGHLTVRGAENSDFGGVIQGSGRLFKDGTGVMTLTGANTYSGGTEVTGGRLVGNTTSLQGAITNSATVEFQQNTNANLGASIIGVGAVVKSGSGALTVTSAQAYTGTTAVESGALKVNGSLAGDVTVSSGALLGGSGLVGGQITVSEGGTLAPGNSPGVFTAANGLALATGSTFAWELTGNTATGRGASFDGVDVTGGTLSIGMGVTSSLVFDFVGSTVDWENVFWSEDRSWLVFDNANLPVLASGQIFDTVTFSADSTGKDLNTVAGRESASFSWTQSENKVFLNYNSVPEPSSASLLVVGIGGLLALRRRRKAD